MRRRLTAVGGGGAMRAAKRRPAIAALCVQCLVGLVGGPALAGGFRAPAPPVTTPSAVIPHLSEPPALEDFAGMRPGANAAGMLHLSELTQRYPINGTLPSQKTDVYLGYTNDSFFVVFLAFDSDPRKVRARMVRRELISDDDNVGFWLDTFDDKHHAYMFYCNPLGVQQDAIFTEDQGPPDATWDTVWRSKGRVTANGYMVWMAIPFKSLRFRREEVQRWGFAVERDIPRTNEADFYPWISTNRQTFLGQEAQLDGIQKIEPGRNIQLIPYASFKALHALDTRDPNHATYDNRAADTQVGLDAKIVLHDSLVLDATIHPDFSQVESDQPQMTVNQRFEVYFPEKRPFFLENAGFFNTPINLVFTRRIADPSAGARLTGKLDRWAIGAMVADDKSPGESVTPGDPLYGQRAYVGFVRINREFGKQNTIGLLYTDRELHTGGVSPECTTDACTIAASRVGGLDGSFKFGKNWALQWQGVTGYTRLNNASRLQGNAYLVHLGRSSDKLDFDSTYNDNGATFQTAPGFFQQPDIRRAANSVLYRFRKNGKHFLWHGPQLASFDQWDHSGLMTRWQAHADYQFNFTGQTSIGAFFNRGGDRLRPVDFSTLATNRYYATGYQGFFAGTALSKRLSFNGEGGVGRDFIYVPRSGPPVIADASYARVFVTVRPAGRLTIDNTYLMSRFLDRQSGSNAINVHILRSKWNYQFNREWSLRVIAQYNTTISNPGFTTLQTTKNLNFDVLLTWLTTPGNALYIGYNSNLENLDPSLALTPDGLARTRNSFLNDGRTVFIKYSHLFRF